MTEEFTAKQQVQKREQYNKWINRFVGFGVTSFFIATAAWIITEERLVLFAGLGLYWLGAIGMGIGYWYSPVSLRDEFEQHTEWEASQATSTFIAAVVIIGIPADVVLSTTGVYTAPTAIRGAIWGYLLLTFIFGAAHWYVKRQYE
jgi:fatty acid desaturase